MSTLSLEGETLGEKHKHINKLVQDAVNSKQINLTKLNKNESDVHNLIQIEIACKTRNVDYILEVLKCDDMLYVSRAIKHSTWLITEQEYSHIINPEYLYTQLFPHMLTKAINKLLLHIRLHLKDEKRVETFYEYIHHSGKSKEATKWLLKCSIPYIEKVIQEKGGINFNSFKRLCKRSILFLQYYTKVEQYGELRTLECLLFLLKSNTEEMLKFLETRAQMDCCSLSFGEKYTEFLMKKCPERILNSFELYIQLLNVATIAKYLKTEDVKDYLFKFAKHNKNENSGYTDHKIQIFIKHLPKEERFGFINKIYINKDAPADELACIPPTSTKLYQWYQYAPFNVAFPDLKKLIRAESAPTERCAILSILILCAKNNPHDIKTLLQYYYDKHRNEPFKFKIQFVNEMLTKNATYKFDNETWNILDKLFHSLEVYIESNNDVQKCLRCIVLYKVLHNESIPDIVYRKLSLDTYKKTRSKLNEEQQNKLFSYLLTSVEDKIKTKTIVNEKDLIDAVQLLTYVLRLLKDWDKDIKDYPFVRDNILNLIKIKTENLWDTDFSSLYHIKKSWRRQMFKESLMLCPSEEVCINILKHDPQMLTLHVDKVNSLKADDNISLSRVLSKLRIYWPDSLAPQWTENYLNSLKKRTGHKTIIKGLFILLPQNQSIDLAKRYVPKDPKIYWDEIDQTELSIIKNIAKYLHTVRPVPLLDVILWYAIGDYLQYTVPSLNAVLHNMSQVQSRKHLSKLLEAPVSLQKHGLHLAFIKLRQEELKPIISNIWKTTKNLTIRARLFTYVHTRLCKTEKPEDVTDFWELLSVFIDNLTVNDNKIIFKILSNPKSIHISIRGEFYMKSYAFLTSLPAAAECDTCIKYLIEYAPFIMDLLNADFVVDTILSRVEETIWKRNSDLIEVVASFILHGKTEDEQCERYKRVLLPALEQIILNWHVIEKKKYVMKDNFLTLLNQLACQFKMLLIAKQIVVPIKLFSELKSLMEQKMSVEEIYVTYTTWKLMIEYVKLVDEYKTMLCDPRLNKIPLSEYKYYMIPNGATKVWQEMHIALSPKFGRVIGKHLKEDTEKYFQTICWCFSDAIEMMWDYLNIQNSSAQIETLKYMIHDDDFIPSYLIVCERTPKYCYDKAKLVEIRRLLAAHPSLEVKMMYHRAFWNIVDEL